MKLKFRLAQRCKWCNCLFRPHARNNWFCDLNCRKKYYKMRKQELGIPIAVVVKKSLATISLGYCDDYTIIKYYVIVYENETIKNKH